MLLHHSTGWVSANDLLKWIEYSNASVFRGSVLMGLHRGRLIEFDAARGRARISPRGAKEVEETLLNSAEGAALRTSRERALTFTD